MAAADPEDLLVDELDELFLTVDNDTGIDSSLKSIPQVKDKSVYLIVVLADT